MNVEDGWERATAAAIRAHNPQRDRAGGAAADGAILKVGRLFDDVSARLCAQQDIAGIGRRQLVDRRAALGIQRLHKGEGLRFENCRSGIEIANVSSCCLLIVPLAVWQFAGGLARSSIVGVVRSLSSCCAYNSGVAGSCQWARQGICAVLEWVADSHDCAYIRLSYAETHGSTVRSSPSGPVLVVNRRRYSHPRWR